MLESIRWLVTGTGTGVGKTVVAAALARMFLDHGDGDVLYVKPAQSGADDGDADAATVARLVGDDPRLRTHVGVRLGPAVAPAVAARRSAIAVSRERLSAHLDDDGPLLVEGAGGLLVELGTDGTTAADLAFMARLQVVIVAGPGLGTLNATMLTIEAAERRGLTVRGVVLSGVRRPPPDLAAATNPSELQRLTGGRLAGLVPVLGSPPSPFPPGTTTAWFAPALTGRLDVAGALRAIAVEEPRADGRDDGDSQRWWRR